MCLRLLCLKGVTTHVFKGYCASNGSCLLFTMYIYMYVHEYIYGCIDKEENRMWFTGAKEIPRDVCEIDVCEIDLCVR